MSFHDYSMQSNATLGVPADFYWIDGGDSPQEIHIELAVEALMGAVRAGPGRLWTPHSDRFLRAMFRKRLIRASQGVLQPPSEVKSLRGEAILFEIRWRGVTVLEGIPYGGQRFKEVEVRLIHAQPFDELGHCLLGLHAHEKVVFDDPEETRHLQNMEIAFAERTFLGGYTDCWGVVRRT